VSHWLVLHPSTSQKLLLRDVFGGLQPISSERQNRDGNVTDDGSPCGQPRGAFVDGGVTADVGQDARCRILHVYLLIAVAIRSPSGDHAGEVSRAGCWLTLVKTPVAISST